VGLVERSLLIITGGGIKGKGKKHVTGARGERRSTDVAKSGSVCGNLYVESLGSMSIKVAEARKGRKKG